MRDVTAAPLVRVIVLNWNSAWLTARCVRSLLQTDHPLDRLDIVVVDNGSIDGSLARLRNDLGGLPSVRFLDNGANLGFAEGCNRAMRDRDGVDAIALVNNDAVVEPGWLAPLLDELARRPDVGAVGSRLMLELPFVTVEIEPADPFCSRQSSTGDALAGTERADGVSRAVLGAVRVDGIDMTRRCLYEGTVDRTDPARPPEITRRVGRGGAVHVPVGTDLRDTPRVELDLADVDVPLRLGIGGAWVDVEPGDAATVALAAVGPRHRRVNGMGTEWTATTEAADRWFGAAAGELDDPRWQQLVPHDTDGFSGGAVLLRPAMLDAVGLFAPSFFAYYEDTDLSRRARRAGWVIRCAPASVIHHLHGGSGGTAATGFHFLNYRNWLLGMLRTGSLREVVAAFRWAKHFARPAFRSSSRGGAGRLGRHARILWSRAAAGVVAAAPSVLASRWLPSRRPVGAAPSDRVRSRLLPRGVPSAPSRWPGGPVTVYLDVTVTLRSGWRAGIQRVVCQLVRHLPVVAPDLRFVPIAWSELHQQFRRISSAEYEALLAPTTDEQPHRHPPPQHPARKKVGDVARAAGLQPLALWVRRRKALRAEPPELVDLLLDRLEPGSVFFDLDAVWNRVTPLRRELAPELAAQGVRGVSFVQDIFAVTNPEWFVPTLVKDFTDFLTARVVTDRVVICSSEDTATSLRRWAKEEGLPAPRTPLVGLGADSIDAVGSEGERSIEGLSGRPFVLVVGTIEPRKNHRVVLDAMEQVWTHGAEVDLVVVGRRGWKDDAISARLESDPTRVKWWNSVTDAQLDGLYRDALVVVVASKAEGYGLPVVEALQRGAAVLSSAGGALAEVGGAHVELFDPDAPADLASLVRRHLEDPEHHRARREVAAAFRPQSWEECARQVADVLRDVASGEVRS